MDRRSFIRSAAGLFVAAAAAPIVEPVRRFWQVGAQLERPRLSGAAVAMQLEHERALRIHETGTLFGISAEPDLWSAKGGSLTWEKLQEGISEWERRSSLPQEPLRLYLTPVEYEELKAYLDNRPA